MLFSTLFHYVTALLCLAILSNGATSKNIIFDTDMFSDVE